MTRPDHPPPEPPLIAHAIFRLDVGGMENGLVNLVNRLPHDKFRHAIICLTESSEFERRLTTDNVRVYELHKRAGKDLWVYPRFWRLLRKLRPALLHTRNLGTLDLAPIAHFARVPVRIHGEHGWVTDDLFGQSTKYRMLRRVCDYSVTNYVAVSQDIAAWLHGHVGVEGDRVRQIYNGVDVDHFTPEGPRAILPFERQDGAHPVIIGAVGRFDPIKNFDLLIVAVARLFEIDPILRSGIRLMIIGDGPELTRLRELAASLGLKDICWLPGKRDDIADLLRATDLFVLPSRNEGISNTVLESMATALPVIASDIGGNPELIVDGETGSLIPANDPDAIAAAIDRYLRDPVLQERHGRAARQRAKECFSLQVMVQNYQQMYEQLLSTNRQPRVH